MEECVHDKHHQGIEELHQHIIVTGKRPHEVRMHEMRCAARGGQEMGGSTWKSNLK